MLYRDASLCELLIERCRVVAGVHAWMLCSAISHKIFSEEYCSARIESDAISVTSVMISK